MPKHDSRLTANAKEKLTKEYLQCEYEEKKRGVPEIAQELMVYPNVIYRALRRFGIERRTNSSAQSALFQQGKKKSPMKDRRHTPEAKAIIGKKISEKWKNLSEEEVERRKLAGLNRWQQKSKEELNELQTLAARGRVKASIEGSKTEKFIKDQLQKEGWSVRFHPTNLIRNETLEVDLFVQDVATAIEIDGITHFEPIFGEEKLQRHVHNDDMKNGLLLNAGFNVIRVKQTRKRLSKVYHMTLFRKITAILADIKLLGETGKLYQVEVED